MPISLFKFVVVSSLPKLEKYCGISVLFDNGDTQTWVGWANTPREQDRAFSL